MVLMNKLVVSLFFCFEAGHLGSSLRQSRMSLHRTGSHTRRSGQLGDTFLTGVDRRVHAPLGTVINFSSILATRKDSSRSEGKCSRVVGSGSSLLLQLVGSVLSLSQLSTSEIEVAGRPYSMIRLYQRMLASMGFSHGSGGGFIFADGCRSFMVGASMRQLRRIVVGLLSGSTGFARSNIVALSFSISGKQGLTFFSIASANYNVPGRGRGLMFRHFRGLSRCTRKAKLKLSVYGLAIRG